MGSREEEERKWKGEGKIWSPSVERFPLISSHFDQIRLWLDVDSHNRANANASLRSSGEILQGFIELLIPASSVRRRIESGSAAALLIGGWSEAVSSLRLELSCCLSGCDDCRHCATPIYLLNLTFRATHFRCRTLIQGSVKRIFNDKYWFHWESNTIMGYFQWRESESGV